MSRKPLKKEFEKEFREKLTDIDLLRDYYKKEKMPDIKFESLEKYDHFSVVGGVDIPSPLLARQPDGTSDLFAEYVLEEIEPSILEKIEVRGLKKEHALALIQDGMTSNQVLEAAQTLPGKESEEMLMLIQSQYEPDLLEDMETLGITFEELGNGKLQVKALSKVAEVAPDGKTKLSPKLKKQLDPFEQMGLLSLNEDFTIEMIEPQEREIAKENAKFKTKNLTKNEKELTEVEEMEQEAQAQTNSKELKLIPLKEKQKALTQDEIEKTKIAKELEVDPSDVQCCIRFSSREVASQYFNDNIDMDHTAILVRLKNNKFWMMTEDGKGNWAKRQGLQTSPASKLLADKLRDTHHKGDTWVLPGEMVAGKTNPNSERYDFFEIMLPGESELDGASSAMYVGCSTDNIADMRILASKNNNVYELEEADVRSIVPSRVFINSNQGERAEIDLDSSKEHKLSDQKKEIGMNDLNNKSELMRKLKEINQKIEEIEYANNNDPENPKTQQLQSLYQERSEILTKLNIKESRIVEEENEQEEEMYHSHNPNRRH